MYNLLVNLRKKVFWDFFFVFECIYKDFELVIDLIYKFESDFGFDFNVSFYIEEYVE